LLLRLNVQLPQSANDIIYCLLHGLGVLALLWGTTFGIRRMIGEAPEALRQGWQRLRTHSLRWLYLGAALYVSAYSPHADMYYVLMAIATIFLSLGQMTLAWDLRSFCELDLQWHSPLRILFIPLLCGVIALLINLPPTSLSVLWSVLLLGIWWRCHKKYNASPLPLERNILKIYFWYLWLLILVALSGWGRLSILLCLLYAAVAVFMQFMVSIVKISNLIMGILPQHGIRGLLGGVAVALAVPVLLLVCALWAVLWILAYPGAFYMLEHVARLDISIGETSLNLAQMLLFVSAFYITRSAVSVGQAFLRQLPAHAANMDKSLVGPLQTVYTYFLWLVFFLFIMSSLGFSLTNIVVVAGGLSVGIGLGLQNIVNNFISGLIVIFGRNLREGDIVDIGSISGVVKRIDIRSTTIETFEHAVVFVPNSTLLSNNLVNWTHNGPRVRRDVQVGVACDSNVDQVVALLCEISGKHKNVLANPKPAVIFERFGESTLDFSLRFWVADIRAASAVQSDLRCEILRVFTENGINIAFPQLDIHLRDIPQTMLKNAMPGN
jgi:small-conductance mechanosensitive channel